MFADSSAGRDRLTFSKVTSDGKCFKTEIESNVIYLTEFNVNQAQAVPF